MLHDVLNKHWKLYVEIKNYSNEFTFSFVNKKKERMKYKKLQNEKDEELANLSEDINKLKRDLETRRDEIEKYKRILETRGSIDNISLTSDEIDDDRGKIIYSKFIILFILK